MTTQEPSVNIVLMLSQHLPQAIRATKTNIAKLEASLTEERANLEVLIRHAAVGNIPHEETEPAASVKAEDRQGD